MDFDREWTPFALDAEVEHFGTHRIAAAGNRLRAENERLRAALEQIAQTSKGYPNGSREGEIALRTLTVTAPEGAGRNEPSV